MIFARALRLCSRLFAGALLALPLACLHVDAEASRASLAVAGMVLECPVGSEGCPCTPGGGCDPGLSCISGFCSAGYGGGGEYEGEYEYEFDEDRMAPPPAPAPVMIEARSESSFAGVKRRDKAGKRADRRAAREQAGIATGSSTAADTVAMPAPAMAEVSAGEPEPGEPDVVASEAAGGRQVIYTATLQVAVYDLDGTMSFAENVPERWGGWIESRYDYQITLRVPAEHLFEIIDAFAERGDVLAKTLRADDVTAEYVDLESRIRVLEEIVAQLELLLKRATTVEEALKIRVQLDQIRIELEAARARMRMLAEMIDFSTLTLYLSARGPIDALPSSNDPFPWVDDLGVEATEYRR